MAITILTYGLQGTYRKSVTEYPLYTDSSLNFRQRLRLLRIPFIKPEHEIIHLLMTPTKINCYFFRTILYGKNSKIVQTVATVRDDLYSSYTLKKMLFGDLIITYSDFAKHKLTSMGIDNVIRIYPGIDTKRFSPAKANKDILNQLGITPKDFTVVYPGEYTRLGAADLFVDSLTELVKKMPNIKIILACRIKYPSDYTKRELLKDVVKSKGLDKHIVFEETISDMPALYNSCDVVAFPVTTMAGKFDVPLSIIEGMACRKPVIVSDLSVFNEFPFEQVGCVVKAGDKDDLVKTIKNLYDDPSLRRNLGVTARQYVLENFSIEQVSFAYEKAYLQLMGEK